MKYGTWTRGFLASAGTLALAVAGCSDAGTQANGLGGAGFAGGFGVAGDGSAGVSAGDGDAAGSGFAGSGLDGDGLGLAGSGAAGSDAAGSGAPGTGRGTGAAGSGAAGTGAAGTGGPMAMPPCTTRASQVGIFGDSYINWGTHTFPDDLATAVGETWRMYAVGGYSMGSGGIGLIPPTFDQALAADPDIIAAVMDGGGNDILIPQRHGPAAPTARTTRRPAR